MGLNIGVFPGDTDPQNNIEPVSHDVDGVTYVVEVYRDNPIITNTYRVVREIELVKPGGTLVNVGHGPDLPPNPYEGQVWILT